MCRISFSRLTAIRNRKSHGTEMVKFETHFLVELNLQVLPKLKSYTILSQLTVGNIKTAETLSRDLGSFLFSPAIPPLGC